MRLFALQSHGPPTARLVFTSWTRGPRSGEYWTRRGSYRLVCTRRAFRASRSFVARRPERTNFRPRSVHEMLFSAEVAEDITAPAARPLTASWRCFVSTCAAGGGGLCGAAAL